MRSMRIIVQYCSSSSMKHIILFSLAVCVPLLITYGVCDSLKSESSEQTDPFEQPINVGDFSSEEFEDSSSDEYGEGEELLGTRMANVRPCFKGYRYSKSLDKCMPKLAVKKQRK